jgi:hypothetical protein
METTNRFSLDAEGADVYWCVGPDFLSITKTTLVRSPISRRAVAPKRRFAEILEAQAAGLGLGRGFKEEIDVQVGQALNENVGLRVS